MLRQMWEFDSKIDYGMPVDTLYVHNVPQATPRHAESYAKCRQFLLNLAGRQTMNGTVSVVERENEGISFGAFSHGFRLLKDKYGFFLFLEDDTFAIRDGIMTQAVKQLMLPAGVQPGFIATLGCLGGVHPLHAGGGDGVAARNVLEKYAAKNGGSLKYINGLPGYGNDTGEIWFTNSLLEMGHPLEDIDFDDVLVRWQNHDRNWRCVVPRETEGAPWRRKAEQIRHRNPEAAR